MFSFHVSLRSCIYVQMTTAFSSTRGQNGKKGPPALEVKLPSSSKPSVFGFSSIFVFEAVYLSAYIDTWILCTVYVHICVYMHLYIYVCIQDMGYTHTHTLYSCIHIRVDDIYIYSLYTYIWNKHICISIYIWFVWNRLLYYIYIGTYSFGIDIYIYIYGCFLK